MSTYLTAEDIMDVEEEETTEFVPFSGINYAAFRRLCENGLPKQLAGTIVRVSLWSRDKTYMGEVNAGEIVSSAKAFISKDKKNITYHTKEVSHVFDGENCSCGGDIHDLTHSILGFLLECWINHKRVVFGKTFIKKLIPDLLCKDDLYRE